MELTNETYKALEEGVDAATIKETVEAMVKLLAPFVPHIAEEMWQRLGNKGSAFCLRWPNYDRVAIQQKEVSIVVQINGKVRAKITAPFDVREEELKQLILQDEKVAKWIKDRPFKKFFVVPNKLVSIVV